MLPQDTKAEFIRMRAEGKSYRTIAAALNISRSTCSNWEADLKKEIATLKEDRLSELYEAYYMTKEARIKKLGETLNRINDALASADLADIDPARLMDYQLKYTEALREEYTGTGEAYRFPDKIELPDIVNAVGDLLNRIREGEITAAQAQKEGQMLTNLLKVYDMVELQTKLEALENVLGGRR